MSITAEEFKEKLDAFIIKVGGSKEEVVYDIVPTIVYKGEQQYIAVEKSSTVLIKQRAKTK